MPGGVFTSGYQDNPGYLVGWIGVSAVPGIEWLTDSRDGLQNIGQGDWGEVALDGVSLLPILVDDAPKAISVTGKWVKVNPSKSDEAYRAIRETGITKHFKLSDRIKLANTVGKHDAAIVRIGEDVGQPSQAKQLAGKLSGPRSKQLTEYDGAYAVQVKRSVVGFYTNGATRDGKFVRYMKIGQVRQFTDDIHYLQASNINYKGAAKSFKQSSYKKAGKWSNAKGAILETRIGVKLAKNGEDVTAIGKRVKSPDWDELSKAEKRKVLDNMPDGITKTEVKNTLDGGDTDLDVVANKNYIEAKNTPNSDVTKAEMKDKFIRFKAMQAVGDAPEGDMILRVSQKAAENGAIKPGVRKFADNVEGFRIGDPVSTTTKGS